MAGRAGGPVRSSGEPEEAAVFDGQRNRPMDVDLLVHTRRVRRLFADCRRGKRVTHNHTSRSRFFLAT